MNAELLSLAVEALASSAVLASLDLSDNADLGDDAMEHVAALLEACPTLTSLSLARTSVGRWGLERLLQGYARHKGLAQLDLSANARIDDAACGVLGKWLALPLCGLTDLRLLDTAVGPKGAVRIAEGAALCPSLRRLVLPHHVGRHVQLEVEEMIAARERDARRVAEEADADRRRLYAGESSAPLSMASENSNSYGTHWQSRMPPPSPRLQQAEVGVLSGSLSDWGGASGRGAMVCLALLEARGAQRSLAKADAERRDSLVRGLGTPRGRATLTPLKPLTSPRAATPVRSTLGDFLARMQ